MTPEARAELSEENKLEAEQEKLEDIKNDTTNMNVTQLREQLQTDSARLLSDWTREDLQRILEKTRQQRGGIALMEIADVIREVLNPEEVRALKDDL